MVRVAEELELDRSSLYRALAPMIRDGWILSQDGTGAHFRTARITKKGRRLLNSADLEWRGVQQGLIKRFGQEAYDSLLAELYRLADCASDLDEQAA